MADAKISELPAATTPLAGTELMEIIQGGVNKKVATSEVGGGAVESVTGNGVDNTDPDNPIVLAAAEINRGTIELATQAETDTGTDDVRAVTPLKAATRYAPLASPALTGTPTAPTAAAGTNTTQVATTAFVQAALSAAKSMVISVTDEVTPIATGTAQVTFRMPYAMTLSSVRASLSSAQASGSIFTVDINEAGSTILSTKLTIDNGETTSVTAATPPVISDTALADDAIITVDVDQIGNGSAMGLKITLIGT